MPKECYPNLNTHTSLKYKNKLFRVTSINNFTDLFNPLKQLCVWFEEVSDENHEHEVLARYTKNSHHRSHGY